MLVENGPCDDDNEINISHFRSIAARSEKDYSNMSILTHHILSSTSAAID